MDNFLRAFVQAPESATENGPETLRQQRPALSNNAFVERYMPLPADTPQSGGAQRFIDPLVLQARFINEAAHIEARLAIRRALRPERSAAARKGWEARRG